MNQVIQEIAQSLVLEEVPDDLLKAYRKALESHNTPMVVVSLDGTLRYLNKEACKLAATNQRTAIGKPMDEVEQAWSVTFDSMIERIENGETLLYFKLDDKDFVCEINPLHDKLGKRIGILQVVRPEEDQNSLEGIDELTGLYERSRFCAATRRLLDHNPDEEYILVFWDVLRFGAINEVFSIDTGNMVLKNIASTIKSFTKNEGTSARFNEDRFAFCIPTSKLSKDWLLRNYEVTLISDTAIYTFYSTYGLYEIKDRSCSVDEMCDRAMLAQTYVDEMGISEGRCFAYYTEEMRLETEESRELTAQLSYALSENQIQPFFQPIFDIAEDEVASAETLARWMHPEKGLIPPGKFIRLFEANGMITELDKHLWRQTAEFQAARLAAGKRVVPISVNVSRVDFFATTLIDDLEEIIRDNNLPRELLRLEITESAYVNVPMRINDIVRRLRDLGYVVLIDDFGSGYSSLNTLKDIPIDILKLDMHFLQDFESSERSKCIIEHIVAMVHKLNFKVIAEGVETQEQADFLHDIDCHFAQGYLYAKPQPKEEFAALLDQTC